MTPKEFLTSSSPTIFALAQNWAERTGKDPKAEALEMEFVCRRQEAMAFANTYALMGIGVVSLVAVSPMKSLSDIVGNTAVVAILTAFVAVFAMSLYSIWRMNRASRRCQEFATEHGQFGGDIAALAKFLRTSESVIAAVPIAAVHSMADTELRSDGNMGRAHPEGSGTYIAFCEHLEHLDGGLIICYRFGLIKKSVSANDFINPTPSVDDGHGC